MKMKNTKTKKTNESGTQQEDLETCISDSSSQDYQTSNKVVEDLVSEWWLTAKADGVVSNKYSITSTGNGNVDISGK
jgi:hypothetical protein